MKRGFLNTQKAKQSAAKAAESEDKTRTTKHVDDDISMIDPHKLPKIIQPQYENKSRVIFRSWPRDPKGEVIRPSPLRGKEAGNGIDLWGATLFDFFHICRMPSIENYITTSTGSRLAKWMRQAGELVAKDELAWADQEEDPKEIPVADIGELIRCRDVRVALGIYNEFSSRKEVRERAKRETSVAAEVEAKDSMPQVNDQIDDAEKEAVPATNDGEEKSVTAATRLDEPMQVNNTGGDKSPGKGTDEPAVPATNDGEEKSVTPAARLDEPMQVDNTGSDKSPGKGTDEPAVSASKHDSPFDPIHYPSPWPFIPCTNDDHPPILQQRLPLHLLPRKIHVHDPWNCLSIDENDDDTNIPWLAKVTEEGDIVQTYSLSLSNEGKQTALAAQKKAELEEDEAAMGENVMRIFPAEEEGPTDEPMIEVVLSPRPRKRTQVEEAHLYFAPPAMGKGNHSYVYFAEWELPRDLFVEPKLCRACVEEDAKKQLQELKDQGKWEDLLKGLMEKLEKAQESGPDVTSEPEHAHAGPKRAVGHVTIKEHRLPHETISFVNGKHRSGSLTDEKTTDVVASEADPLAGTASHATETGDTDADVEMDVVEERDVEPGDKGESKDTEADVEMDVVEKRDVEPGDKGESKEPSAEGSAPQEEKGKDKEMLEQDSEDEEKEQGGDEQNEEEIFTIQPPRIIRVASYSGPAVRINTNVKWRLPWEKACRHGGIGSGNPVPRTATVSVAVKLSIEHDAHLQREARNYQLFPSHFFEHWNGYNVIPPLHDPVPVGALCPQFYGYYTPDNPTDGKRRPSYLSPILLLEHCGAEIVPENLNQDDKQECASLLFRFHHAGWLHESFAARNILWQQGKPREWPIERRHSEHKSFRLIDFGRSTKIENSSHRMQEEEAGLRLLHLNHFSM